MSNAFPQDQPAPGDQSELADLVAGMTCGDCRVAVCHGHGHVRHERQATASA
jgi:hypothetical protein